MTEPKWQVSTESEINLSVFYGTVPFKKHRQREEVISNPLKRPQPQGLQQRGALETLRWPTVIH